MYNIPLCTSASDMSQSVVSSLTTCSLACSINIYTCDDSTSVRTSVHPDLNGNLRTL